MSAPPTRAGWHLFGTDELGRDLQIGRASCRERVLNLIVDLAYAWLDPKIRY